MKSISYLVVTAMIFGAILASCNENDDNPGEFTVTFDSNGGSIVNIQRVKAGEKIAELEEDPKLIGHAFTAWYSVTIYLIAANENGDFVPTPWKTDEVDANEAEGEYCWHGFDSKERLFGAFVRDRWDNYSDTLLVAFTPLVDL